MRAIEEAGEELVAIYHSHTKSAAYPSQTDVNLAGWPDAVYLIVSLAEPDAPDVKGFWIKTARSPMPSLSSSKGKLVKVAYAQQQVEAEMIQGLLSEHGIPSMLQRAAGFDVPDFLAAGPREVLVAEELAEQAREVLEGTPGAD